MIIKKTIVGFFLLYFLNGCVQGTVFLGPTYTLVSTGSIYQTGVSYGSSKAIKKITSKTSTENKTSKTSTENKTSKTSTENIKSLVDNKKIKVEEEENHEEFFALVKSRIEKTSKIIQLANQ